MEFSAIRVLEVFFKAAMDSKGRDPAILTLGVMAEVSLVLQCLLAEFFVQS